MKVLGLFHQRKENKQNLNMDIEKQLEKAAKTSIADIQSMVAEQRETMDFGRTVSSNPYYSR
ncbi:MAG: hypothetical protein HFH60_13100 [Lachnospiraceae bacterium]|nr:hypothetical protein [Lachnospiraceae bacterium]